MTGPIELPSEFEHLADLTRAQPPGVRDLFRYPLVLASIDGEKPHVIGTHIGREREYLIS